MYKNIIFDLGGVMVQFNPREYLLETFHDTLTERKLYDMTFGSPEWPEVDAGRITRFAADSAMLERCRLAGLGFEGQEIVDHWPNILRTRRDVEDIAAMLKAQGYRLYCLSNIAEDTAALLQRRSFWQLFDGAVLSWEVQCLKPDPQIYKTLLEKYHLNPAESIFIDDNKENVLAAHKLGITGIEMTPDADQLLHSLRVGGIRIDEDVPAETPAAEAPADADDKPADTE